MSCGTHHVRLQMPYTQYCLPATVRPSQCCHVMSKPLAEIDDDAQDFRLHMLRLDDPYSECFEIKDASVKVGQCLTVRQQLKRMMACRI